MSDITTTPDTRPLKPGVKTTEFWSTAVFPNLIAAVTAIMAMFGHTFDGSSLQPLVPAFAALGSAFATAIYSHSRAKVKKAALLGPAVTSVVGPAVPAPDPTVTRIAQ